MDIVKILVSALAATITMTGFSYLISAAYKKLFKEPVLLNKILERLGIDVQDGPKKAAGYILHYLIGVLFVIGYDLLWRYTTLDPTWFCGIIFGIFSGIIGIGGWMTIFRLPDMPPRVHFKEYYIQLFIAHIIFALTAVAVYHIYGV